MAKIKIIIALLFVVYFVTRLINILALPIFNDEAFFIHATRQIIASPINNLFFNFSDGKEPFFFWLYTLPVKFSPDVLFGIRIFTVFLGGITLFYLIKISQKLSLNILLVGLAYVVSPFLLFYHRIAMQETLLTLLLVAGFYYLLAKNQILAGIFMGLALLTKTSSLAMLIFFAPFLVYRRHYRPFIIAGLIYLPVVIGFSQISAHNSSYFGQIPVSQMIVNLKMATKWLWDYQGPLGLLGLLMPPVILESLVAKIFYPRYFLFVIPFLILLISKFTPRYIFFLLLIPNIILSYQIITDVKTANLPYIEKWQYIEAWPAGEGIKETAAFLKSQNAKTVITEDIMIAQNGLEYYYPEAAYKTSGVGDYDVYIRDQKPITSKTLVFSYLNKIKVYR